MCFCNQSCCKNIRWGAIFVSAIIYTIIAFLARTGEAMLTMNYYMMPQYFSVWSKVMMPTAGPPPTSFYIISLLFSFVAGIILALFYNFIKDKLCAGYWQKVVCFTGIVSVLAFVFSTLPMYLMINLPVCLMLIWFASSVVIFFVSSMVFAKIIK
ncbi:MAG: hypothetical protein PHG23_02150 [Candidatus Pacebacteria bacterium]|nr:hypothetical protein [Candidatus Paceibacterota bacterium]